MSVPAFRGAQEERGAASLGIAAVIAAVLVMLACVTLFVQLRPQPDSEPVPVAPPQPVAAPTPPPKDPYTERLGRAKDLYDTGHWTQAFVIAERVLMEDPAHAGALDMQHEITRARETLFTTHNDAAGEITVACLDAPGQTYELYAPPGCPVRQTPILYLFNASGNGKAILQWFVQESVRHNWVIAASNNSKNGPWEPIFEAQDAVLRDIAERLDLHPAMRFASGFSGGARAALALAFRYPGQVCGVLAMGAGWPVDTELQPPATGLNVYILIGNADCNIKGDIPRTEKNLIGAGINCVTEVYQGGHVRPPEQSIRAGCDWLQSWAKAAAGR